MENIKILIVDDEPDILEILRYNLSNEGYQVIEANCGNLAIKQALEHLPDLILLDIMLPDIDGVEVCRILRSEKKMNQTIVAFLTARSEEYSEIAGFDVGADDYISKPIKPRVLLRRIKGLLRRKSEQTLDGEIVVIGNLKIDKQQHLVYVDGKPFDLPKKEFDLLVLFATKPGKVFSRSEILNDVWGSDIIVGDRTIDVHIRKLREKLGSSLIKTIKGIGYKMDV